mgnify:CR=1 FL=1
MTYPSLEYIVAEAASGLRPAELLTVTEAGEKYHIIRQPGSHNGPWSRNRTPYMVEPQDILTSIDHEAMIFAGPARTGKSIALTNWVAHTVKCDPADMMVVHMAQHTAREWVKSDLEKSITNSPEIARELSPGRNDDNIFDKQFRSGMRLIVTWPTIRNLSAKTIPRSWLMDRDRMDDDIDKEGDPFDLAKKRSQTFGRFGMTAAESSPGREVINPRWLPKTPHEAPPCTGILGLYNLGDRRRWYWACPDCEEAFEPDFPLLHWTETEDIAAAAASVYMVCPHCGSVIGPDQKDALNSAGRWVRDGMIWYPARDVIEARPGMTPAGGKMASFWLKGPAAGFQTWAGLVENWLKAEKAYKETGDETKLKATTNTDQGHPYISRARLSERMPDEVRQKAEDWGATEEDPTVPEGVRFLIATVDVQARSFVAQVHGFTLDGDVFVVDAFKLRISDRPDGDGRFLPVEPPVFAEDWKLLTEKVINKTYPLADDSGRRMRVLLTGCDSGGRDGSTANAYAYWRGLKAAGGGLHRKFALVKGNPLPKAPRAFTTWPDSNKTGKLAVARGDVPVMMLGSNDLKDQVAALLNRRTSKDEAPGGKLRYPTWLPDWFATQMTNEVRTEKGWLNPASRRNEAWDLAYYAVGLAVRPYEQLAPWGQIQWEKLCLLGEDDALPLWAEEWDINPLVFDPGAPEESVPLVKSPLSRLLALAESNSDS